MRRGETSPLLRCSVVLPTSRTMHLPQADRSPVRRCLLLELASLSAFPTPVPLAVQPLAGAHLRGLFLLQRLRKWPCFYGSRRRIQDRRVVKAADLCNFLLCAVQQMVRQCRGQLVTHEPIYAAGRGGTDQVCVVSRALNELIFNASFICREGERQSLLLPPLKKDTHGNCFPGMVMVSLAWCSHSFLLSVDEARAGKEGPFLGQFPGSSPF